MDYSNIKKIFYILCIISILFSLKSKVFGAFSFENNGHTFEVGDNFINYSPYYAFFATSNGVYICCIRSNSPLYTNSDDSDSYAFYTYYNKDSSGMDYFAAGYDSVQNRLISDNFSVITDTSITQVTTNWYTAMKCIYTNHDIKNITSNEVIIEDSSYNAPSFDNVTEIENGYPDGVFISRGDYSENDKLYFHLLKITNTVADGNQSVYYYNDRIFELVKGNKYYQTYLEDNPSEHSYYFVDRASLSLDTDSSYLYVLSSNSSIINNSYGILQPDEPAGIYDVVESDTAGVISAQDAINDKIQNINNNQQEITNTLTENTISTDTETDINTSLNYNNNNADLTGFHNGFFTRLANILNSLVDYDLDEDSTIEFPVPYTNQSITIHSYSLKNNIPESLYYIIQSFWLFIFTFYLFKFINKIYISFSTGEILSNFDSKDEVITNSML